MTSVSRGVLGGLARFSEKGYIYCLIGILCMKNTPLDKICRYLGTHFESSFEIAGFQIDSRKIAPGELFFALKGETVDGHLFLQEVKAKGGAAAVVSKGYSGDDFGLFLIRVEDVLESLHALARHLLQEKRPQIVGVTGSVGKTTVKEFIATFLEAKYKVFKSFSSYNTKFTFPLMLLNRRGDEEVLVLEMGMSEPGDISRLVQIAAPDIAVLTKVGMAHAAFFPGGIQEIARGKCEIFSHPTTKSAVFHHRLYQFEECLRDVKQEKVSYSLENKDADYFLSKGEGRYFIDERGIRAYELDLPFSESHILENFLAAAVVARLFKMEWEEIDRQTAKLQLPKMRFEVFEKGGVRFINDAYNANPESMRAALSNLPQPKEGGKKIGVLGAMKELGSFSKEEHLEVGRQALKAVDHLLTLGEEAVPIFTAFEEAKRPAEAFLEIEPLVKRLKELLSPGDVVLVKGSRSMRMERLFDYLEI